VSSLSLPAATKGREVSCHFGDSDLQISLSVVESEILFSAVRDQVSKSCELMVVSRMLLLLFPYEDGLQVFVKLRFSGRI